MNMHLVIEVSLLINKKGSCNVTQRLLVKILALVRQVGADNLF